MLGWIYFIVFALQVFWLIKACLKKHSLHLLLAANVCSILLSGFLLWYFDTLPRYRLLPGYGIVSGFAYFPEVFASLCAMAAFLVLTIITFFCRLYQRKK